MNLAVAFCAPLRFGVPCKGRLIAAAGFSWVWPPETLFRKRPQVIGRVVRQTGGNDLANSNRVAPW